MSAVGDGRGSLAGRTVGGAYVLVEPVGRGGMGEVWRARQSALGRDVALKLLAGFSPSTDDRGSAARRLRDEAAAAGLVRHPRLVTLLDAGDDPELGFFVVYELLSGTTLRTVLDRQEALPWDRVADGVARDLLDALGALHGAGIVHRDVKPENLFLGDDGRYRLGDLGLAVFEGRGSRTATGAFVASVGYVAPERIGGVGEVGPACDVYAAAAVLVEAVTGRLPFKGTSTVEILSDQLKRRVAPAELRRLGVPPSVAAVLARALDPDPARRCPDVATLARELRQAAVGGEEPSVAAASATRAVRSVPDRPAPVPALPVFPAGLGRAPSPARRLVVALLVVLGLLGVAAAVLPGGRPGISSSPERSALALLEGGAVPSADLCAAFGEALPGEAPPRARGRMFLSSFCASRGDAPRAAALNGQLLQDDGPTLPQADVARLFAEAATGAAEAGTEAAWRSVLGPLVNLRGQGARWEVALVAVGETWEELATARIRALGVTEEARLARPTPVEVAARRLILEELRVVPVTDSGTSWRRGALDLRCRLLAVEGTPEAREELETTVDALMTAPGSREAAPSSNQWLARFLADASEHLLFVWPREPGTRERILRWVGEGLALVSQGDGRTVLLAVRAHMIREAKGEGWRDACVATAQEALDAASGDYGRFRGLLALAWENDQTGRHPQSRAYLDRVEETDVPADDLWRVLGSRGLAEKRLERFQEAVTLQRRALAAAPLTRRYYMGLVVDAAEADRAVYTTFNGSGP